MDDLDLLHYLFLHHHLYGHLLDHLDNPDDLLLHDNGLAGHLHLLHHLFDNLDRHLDHDSPDHLFLHLHNPLDRHFLYDLPGHNPLHRHLPDRLIPRHPAQKAQPLSLADDSRNVPDDERDEEKRRGWSGHAGRPDQRPDRLHRLGLALEGEGAGRHGLGERGEKVDRGPESIRLHSARLAAGQVRLHPGPLGAAGTPVHKGGKETPQPGVSPAPEETDHEVSPPPI